jgi:small-conductance mechanosensitive channel
MTDLAADNAGGQATWWQEIIDYELITGNAIWRFGLVLLVILLAMAGGRIAQYLLSAYAERRKQQKGVTLVTLCCDSLAKPVYVAFFAAGIFLAKAPLRFDELKGLSPTIDDAWTKVAEAVAAIAFAYALYRLVDVAEYYLNRIVSKTQTKLDDMLVPVVRKSLRVTIAIVATLIISESILGTNVKSLLLSAGVGGIALALAAKDTIANFFGSITIFAGPSRRWALEAHESGRSRDIWSPCQTVSSPAQWWRTSAGAPLSAESPTSPLLTTRAIRRQKGRSKS